MIDTACDGSGHAPANFVSRSARSHHLSVAPGDGPDARRKVTRTAQADPFRGSLRFVFAPHSSHLNGRPIETQIQTNAQSPPVGMHSKKWRMWFGAICVAFRQSMHAGHHLRSTLSAIGFAPLSGLEFDPNTISRAI